MKTKEQVNEFSDKKFYRVYGVKKPVFNLMLNLLEKEYEKEHKRGGKPPKLSVFDRINIFFMYYHDYMTYEVIANEYNIANSTVHHWVNWVEEVLIKSGEFKLPGKRELMQTTQFKSIVIDASECAIERPKKNRKNTTVAKRKDTH